MAESAIPADLANPGHVFACLGLAEAAEVLLGGVRGGYEWDDSTAATFRLAADGAVPPVAAVLEFLLEAEVSALYPAHREPDLSGWSIECTPRREDLGFPVRVDRSPATLPAVLRAGDRQITVDYWGDSTKRDSTKFWAGAKGKPGPCFLSDALGLIQAHAAELATADNLLEFTAPGSSCLRMDHRSSYIALDSGFSLNQHKDWMYIAAYPLVEALAPIGLTHARPDRPDPRDKLVYRYSAMRGTAFPIALLRAALGGAALPFPQRSFRMFLDWPGQENQARCITSIVEET